jgi:hypothetical protein
VPGLETLRGADHEIARLLVLGLPAHAQGEPEDRRSVCQARVLEAPLPGERLGREVEAAADGRGRAPATLRSQEFRVEP